MKKLTVIAGFILLIGGSGPARDLQIDPATTPVITIPADKLEQSVNRLDSSLQRLNRAIKYTPL